MACFAQSSVGSDIVPAKIIKTNPIVFDGSVVNSVQNVGEKPEAILQENQVNNTADATSKISSVNGTAVVLQPSLNKTADLSSKVYTRKTTEDTPIDFSNGIRESYQRKTNEDKPVDYSNGVVQVYTRKQSDNPNDQNIQKESPKLMDKNSSIYSTTANSKVPKAILNPSSQSTTSTVSAASTAKQVPVQTENGNQKSSTD